MRRRVLWVSGGLFVLALTLILASAAAAQQATAISIPNYSAEIGELLRRGRQLEIEQRWGEALSHYEDAVRQFPLDDSLQRRFDFTRLHYDLGRRYADRSFRESVATLPLDGALRLYANVLLKIEAHYVQVPHWKELIERGTNNLEMALSEPVFLEQNVPRADRAALEEFRRELRGTLGPRVIATRHDAREAVAAAAALGLQRLNISPTAVVLEYLCGATNALDHYSTYLTPDQLNEVYAQIEGNFVGLGIELKSRNGQLLIVRVIPASPAQEAGIRAADRITMVDGQSTAGLSTDQAASLLQGEAGSVVRLMVVTPGSPPRQLTIRRRRVDVPSIDRAEILDSRHGIAYLKLVCFQKTTCNDLDEALWKLHRQGMRSLIIDLRGNPGGLLVTSVEVVDKFVDRGIIVSTRGRDTRENFTYSAHAAGTWRMPLVVLIDRDSASAAEIFAGAIRDHRRGTIIGTRSYGKGSVQGIFPLDVTSAGVRLTTAKFYSPAGRPYSGIGVEPNVVVRLVAKPVAGSLASGEPQDPILSAALQAARAAINPQQALERLPVTGCVRWRQNGGSLMRR